MLIGAVTQLDFVWLVADTLNAFMAFPNLVSLLLLSPVIAKLTQEYFASAPPTSDDGGRPAPRASAQTRIGITT